MNQIVVFYNPFLPELKISVNGRKLSAYSALMRFRHQRLEKWCDSLFEDLHREVNSEYEVVCVSNEFCCQVLGDLARRSPYCSGFAGHPLPLDSNVYERLEKMELLGCEEEESSIRIPVLNASGDDAMTAAVYEILEEQGIFDDVTPDGVAWHDCPLAELELVTCRSAWDLPGDAPCAFVLCSSESDYVSIGADIPAYALIMGTETKYLGHRSGKMTFTVDPDDIGSLILNVIEEEALCPLLSQLSYQFPEEAEALLTESEKESLALICHASPVCRVDIPRICDLGRAVPLDVRFFPRDADVSVRVVSDETSVLEVDGTELMPRAVGTAEVSVFLGSDPYPSASEIIRVRSRNLITAITLFPARLCLPEGGSGKLELTLVPADAENADEITWDSSDPTVASVDARTGIITARACGRCRIRARTREASAEIGMEVQHDLEDIVLPGSYVELAVGEQKEWRYKAFPENAYGADMLRVLISNRDVADYRGGYIIGKGVGESRIYIKSHNGEFCREFRVTVKKNRKLW